jgi:hypothetical protein
LADPTKQWKSGYSAKALAHCWQEADGFPESVRAVFSVFGVPFADAELVLAIPEHRVALPGGSRASQTDLFALAHSGSDLISIAVEGKVAEAFDATVGEWLDRRAAEQAKRHRTRQPSAQARRRLAFLCELLQLEEGDILDLRYQLLHRTAAAILEAQRFAAHHALMLVHLFGAEDASLDDYQSLRAADGCARRRRRCDRRRRQARWHAPLPQLDSRRGALRARVATRPITCSPPRLSRRGCGGVWH